MKRSSSSTRRCAHDPAAIMHDAGSAMVKTAVILSIILLSGIILFAAGASATTASIDLLSPADQISSSNTTTQFGYYASLPGLTDCAVMVNGATFPDAHAQTNAMNSVNVQAMTPGNYTWNVTCDSPNATVTSATRSFIIDTQAPNLTINGPVNGSVVNSIALDMVAADDTSGSVTCQALWQGQLLEQFSVADNIRYTKNYTGAPGNGTLQVTCSDAAGNAVQQSRTIMYVPDFGLNLQTDKAEYGISEPVRLTITTIPGANVTVDICPNQTGFVQCSTALLGNSNYPQTITLPYMNKTGSYLVEGIATFAGQSKANRTYYSVLNSIVINLQTDVKPKLNTTFQLSAQVSGGIPPYTLSWSLWNGTTVQGTSAVHITHFTPGNYLESVTAYDAVNNTATVNYNYTVLPVDSVTFTVTDNQTGEGLSDVALEVTGVTTGSVTQLSTIQGGLAYADLETDTYRVFASAPGYQYALDEFLLNDSNVSSYTMPVALQRNNDAVPIVSILTPAPDGNTTTPASISFSVQYNDTVNCTLYFSAGSNWFTPNGSLQVSDGGAKTFRRDLSPGDYLARVECADIDGHSGASPVINFTVVDGGSGAASADGGGAPSSTSADGSGSAAATPDDVSLQQESDSLDAALQNLDTYGAKEKEAVALLGFDENLRSAKRAVLQAMRDLDALQYRNDLDANGQAAERKRILSGVQQLLSDTPRGLSIDDSKSFVHYVTQIDVDDTAATLAGLGGLTSDKALLAKQLLPDQQKFTITTSVLVIDYTYADASTKTVTVVSHSFTYEKNLSSDYQLYEIIPKEVAKSAGEITAVTGKAETLKDDPVLRFNQQGSVTYVIPERVDLTRIETVTTVLARPYADATNAITGFAILTTGDIAGVSTPVLLLLAIILLAYITYYFDLLKHLSFLFYRIGKKEKVHYLEVLINDTNANLDANNYEKADIMYKEIRLTYDTLSVQEKNDLFDDIMELLHRMDAYYFNLVMIELDGHLKANDLEAAIQSYEKLTSVYGRLDAEHQQQLIQTVTALAKRMGISGVAS